MPHHIPVEDAVRHAEEYEARERARAQRFEGESRRGTRRRNWIATPTGLFTVVALVIAVVALYYGFRGE